VSKKRILISRTDRLGDVVLSTGIPRAVKNQFPDAFVALMLREYTKDIYINNPFVDQIIVFDPDNEDKNYFKEKILEIRMCKFTHAAMLLPNKKINSLLFYSLIPHRYGKGYKFYQFITGVKGISRHKYIPLRHEADYCMDLIRAMGVKTDNYNSEIFLDDDEKKKSAEIKNIWKGNNAESDKIIVGVHCTSGDSAPHWRPDIYRRLIDLLLDDCRFSVVVTDNNIPDEVAGIKGVYYPNINKSLRESIINIAALDCMISSSTGPMHIAAALRIKTLSMFCTITACSPKLWGPLGNIAEIITPNEEYCKTQCPHGSAQCYFSMEGGITAEMVLTRLKEFFRIP
jgi:heptosyltransferase-2